jgi:WG containing repeat
MKIKNFILFLIIFLIQNLFAQRIYETKHDNGTLESRTFYQKDGEPFYKEKFNRNGKLFSKVWYSDSSCFWDRTGTKIIEKTFGRGYHSMDWVENLTKTQKMVVGSEHASVFPNNHNEGDRCVEYFANGNLHRLFYWRGDSALTQYTYFQDGTINNFVQYHLKNKHQYDITYQYGNQKSVSIQIDELAEKEIIRFYDKNKLYLNQEYHFDTLTAYQRNDFRGDTLVKESTEHFTWVQNDTLRLEPDKNVILGQYGFRNHNGNWVIKPQYESIEPFNKAYFIVHKDFKYGLLNQYGKIIIPLIWDNLTPFKKESTENEHNLPLFVHQPDTNMGLICRKGDLEGVIDIFGNLVLPCVYDSIMDYKNDLYKVTLHKQVFMVDKQGKIVVKSPSADLDFTQHPDLFITKDTAYLPDDSGEMRMRYKIGLMNDKGKILLQNNFSELRTCEATAPRVFVTTDFMKEVPFRYYIDDFPSARFHADKGWLLDSSLHFVYSGFDDWDTPIKIVEKTYLNPKTNEIEIVKGIAHIIENSILLPVEYEAIEWLTEEITRETPPDLTRDRRFIKYRNQSRIENIWYKCKKQGKYGLFDAQQKKWVLPTIYDELFVLGLGDDVFLVLKNGSWQFINAQQKRLLTETFEDAGTTHLQKENEFGREASQSLSPSVVGSVFVRKQDRLRIYSTQTFPFRDHLKDVCNDSDQDIIKKSPQKITIFNFKEDAYLINVEGKIIASPTMKPFLEKKN